MLRHRLITGPILIAILLGVVLLDARFTSISPRGILLFGLALPFALVGGWELADIAAADRLRSCRWLTALAAGAALTTLYVLTSVWTADAAAAGAVLASVLGGLLVLSLFVFSRGQKTEGVLAATGVVLYGFVGIGVMLSFLLALRAQHSPWLVVGAVLLTKTCDTGAYFTGRAIGRHKLIPWLSPGKTWEGLAGGVISAALAGVLVAAASRTWLAPVDHVPAWVGLVCGIVFGVVGQLGDLTVSLLKRGAGIKDSSSILPGLGGVLDVLDSPLLVAPVAYWMITTML